ncbi:MAG: hypothetical protein ABIH69_07660 [bacterium]|nr:hypothetical protein [Candidatus Margulisiibacteriota bacterium]
MVNRIKSQNQENPPLQIRKRRLVPAAHRQKVKKDSKPLAAKPVISPPTMPPMITSPGDDQTARVAQKPILTEPRPIEEKSVVEALQAIEAGLPLILPSQIVRTRFLNRLMVDVNEVLPAFVNYLKLRNCETLAELDQEIRALDIYVYGLNGGLLKRVVSVAELRAGIDVFRWQLESTDDINAPMIIHKFLERLLMARINIGQMVGKEAMSLEMPGQMLYPTLKSPGGTERRAKNLQTDIAEEIKRINTILQQVWQFGSGHGQFIEGLGLKRYGAPKSVHVSLFSLRTELEIFYDCVDAKGVVKAEDFLDRLRRFFVKLQEIEFAGANGQVTKLVNPRKTHVSRQKQGLLSQEELSSFLKETLPLKAPLRLTGYAATRLTAINDILLAIGNCVAEQGVDALAELRIEVYGQNVANATVERGGGLVTSVQNFEKTLVGVTIKNAPTKILRFLQTLEPAIDKLGLEIPLRELQLTKVIKYQTIAFRSEEDLNKVLDLVCKINKSLALIHAYGLGRGGDISDLGMKEVRRRATGIHQSLFFLRLEVLSLDVDLNTSKPNGEPRDSVAVVSRLERYNQRLLAVVERLPQPSAGLVLRNL